MNEDTQNFEHVLEEASKLTYEEKQRLIEKLTAMMSTGHNGAGRKLRSMYGIWKDIPRISDEDIQEARKEMWGNFPREDIV